MYTNEQLNAIHFSKIGFEFEFFANDEIKVAKESIANEWYGWCTKGS
jgi:hypothetical protein